MSEVILNDEEVVRFRDALLMRIAGINTKQVRNVLEELLYRLGATVSGGELPNEFQRMKLECREAGLMLRDDNGDCYNWKSNPKGLTLPKLEKWARSQCPEAREGCPKVSADSMGQLLPPAQPPNITGEKP